LGAHPNATALAAVKAGPADAATANTCEARTTQLKLSDSVRYLLLTSRSFWLPNVTEAAILSTINATPRAAFDLPGLSHKLATLSNPVANDVAVVLLHVTHR